MTNRDTIVSRAEELAGIAGFAFPEATPDLLARADQIAGGTLFFYQDTAVKTGLTGIDWTGQHLDHQEWPAQLNRFYYLAPLASAYRATEEERYPQAARSYIEDWIRGGAGYEEATAFRDGDSSLNMAGRLGSSHSAGWAGALPAFLESPAFDDAFLDTVLASIASQVSFLSQYLTGWGNWRVAELDTIVFTALRLPFLPQASELLDLGITGMRSALATQFLPDGVHVERTPSYHQWMAQVLTSYYHLARHFREADAHVDPVVLGRALDYTAQSDLSGLNDSSPPHVDPEALRGLATRSRVVASLLSDRGLSPTPPLAQVFSRAGHVFVRSDWQPGADYLAFDAGTWGGGHGHLSRLAFTFRAGGRELLADPGILTYEMGDPFGPYGKSTLAHSTISLDGWNQSEADAQLLRTEFTPNLSLIHACYQGGYWPAEYGWSFGDGHSRGAYGLHDRVLLWIRGEYLLALDAIRADRDLVAHNCWQLGPMDGWERDCEHLAWRSCNQDQNLYLQFLPFQGDPVEMECFEGARDPLRGWVCHHHHDAIPAPQVEFRYPAHPAGAVSATFLLPYQGAKLPDYTVRWKVTRPWIQTRHLQIASPEGVTDHLAWSHGLSAAVDDEETFVTDAPFVWLRTRADGAPTEAFLLDGSFLRFQGKALHDAPRRETGDLSFG